MNMIHFSEIIHTIRNKEDVPKLTSLINFFLTNNLLENNNFHHLIRASFSLPANLNKPIIDTLLNFINKEELFNQSTFNRVILSNYSEYDISKRHLRYLFNDLTFYKNIQNNSKPDIKKDHFDNISMFDNNIMNKCLNETPYPFMNINDIDIVKTLFNLNVKLKPEHFIGSRFDAEDLKAFVDIDCDISNNIPFFIDKKCSLKNINTYCENFKFNQIDDDYPLLSLQNHLIKNDNINKNSIFSVIKEKKLYEKSIGDIPVSAFLILNDFDWLKKMIDFKKISSAAPQDTEKLKNYLLNNKYLKNIPDLFEILYISCLIKHENSGKIEQQQLLHALNLIQPIEITGNILKHYIPYLEHVGYSKNFKYSEETLPLISNVDNQTLLKLSENNFNNTSLFLDLLPKTYSNNSIQPQCNNVLNASQKGILVSIDNLTNFSSFFYGFKNDSFRELNSKDPIMIKYTEKETLFLLTEKTNKKAYKI